jgi:hypothetical protein
MKRIIVSACLLVAFICAIPTPGQAQRRRTRPSRRVVRNRPPVINSFTASSKTVIYPCPMPLIRTVVGCSALDPHTVTLNVNAHDPDNDPLRYSYTVTAGRISGEGRMVVWNLTGIDPGFYDIKVEVSDGRGTASDSIKVDVVECPECDLPCPTLELSSLGDVEEGQQLVFAAYILGGNLDINPTYNWTLSAGKIVNGQSTQKIYVETAGLGGQQITATVKIGGIPPACEMMRSNTAQVRRRR